MGAFRDRMEEDLRIRGYSPSTIQCYLARVKHFVAYFMRPPDQLTPEHIRTYQVHLTDEVGVGWAVFNQTVCALRFFFRVSLGKDWTVEALPYRRAGNSPSCSAGSRFGACWIRSSTSSTAPF